MGNDILRDARQYLDLGKSIIPLIKKQNEKGVDKFTPFNSWKIYQEKLTTIEQWKSWSANQRPGELGIGIVTGKLSNLTVMDIDQKNGVDGWASLAQLEAIFGKLPPTIQVKTPHGMHLYFSYIEGSRNSVGVIGDGIDIRSEGGFVVAPPTPGYEYATSTDFTSTGEEEDFELPY